jgi:arylformamidase
VNTASRGAPLVFCVGGDESSEFHRQQRDFVAAYRARGFAAETVDAPGLHHLNVVDELILPGRPLHQAVRRQMGLAGGAVLGLA